MWFFIALAAVLVLAIASYTVFRVSARLSHTESVSVYDPKAAADYIMRNLPESWRAPGTSETSAEAPREKPPRELGRTEVEFLLGCHLDYLRASGIASQGLGDLVAMEMAEKTSNPVVSEDQAVDFVLAQVQESDFEIDTLEVVVVLDLSTKYMESIGAIGPKAEEAEEA